MKYICIRFFYNLWMYLNAAIIRLLMFAIVIMAVVRLIANCVAVCVSSKVVK